MRTLTLTALLSSLLVACGGGSSNAQQASEAPGADAPAKEAPAADEGTRSDISVDELKRRLQADPSIQVVDVRTKGEWRAGHIPTATLVPVQELSVDHPDFQGIDKSKPVYFICKSGSRSSRAADMMAAEGYDVVNVEGGMTEWLRKRYPFAIE